MRRTTRWHSASAVSEVSPDGVLVVRMHGPISDEALRHFRRDKAAAYHKGVKAVVVDYTSAALVVSPEEMTLKVIDAPPGSMLLLPAALVVHPDYFTMFRQHARAVAAIGAMRRVFFSLTPAVAWAASEVSVRGAAVAGRAE